MFSAASEESERALKLKVRGRRLSNVQIVVIFYALTRFVIVSCCFTKKRSRVT